MTESGSGADPAGMLLIVNADDYGMTDGTCRGALEAHRCGLVSSISVLANGRALRSHVAAARDSGFGTGAHLAAVGSDPPLLGAREVPSLVDRHGRFPLTWQQFVGRAAAGRVDPDDLRREFGAQIEALRHHGLDLSHLDSHQNLHLWPSVGRVLLGLATEFGVATIRIPRAATLGPVSLGVRALSARLARNATGAGVAFPGASMGLDEVSGDHRHGLVAATERLVSTGTASAELILHLAADPDPARSRHPSRFRWAEQLRAACDPFVVQQVRAAGVRLGSFHDLTAATRPAVTATRTVASGGH